MLHSPSPSLATALVLLAISGVATSAGVSEDENAAVALERFLTRVDEPLVQYRALRHMKARNGRFRQEGWLDAWTETDVAGGFRYKIVAEGGSSLIRNRVLRKQLEEEAKALSNPAKIALNHENYEFSAAPVQSPGTLRLLISPKRKEALLIDGSILIAPDGELLKVEGKMARSPSRWARTINIVRNYARIGGVRAIVTVRSEAGIRLVGNSTFEASYKYESINGRRVDGNQEPGVGIQEPAGANPEPGVGTQPTGSAARQPDAMISFALR